MWYVYILQSIKNNRFYIGYTSNIEYRLFRHNDGSNRSTKAGRPWCLIYQENYPSKSDAIKREKQVKSYKGGEAFQKLIKQKIK